MEDLCGAGTGTYRIDVLKTGVTPGENTRQLVIYTNSGVIVVQDLGAPPAETRLVKLRLMILLHFRLSHQLFLTTTSTSQVPKHRDSSILSAPPIPTQEFSLNNQSTPFLSYFDFLFHGL